MIKLVDIKKGKLLNSLIPVVITISHSKYINYHVENSVYRIKQSVENFQREFIWMMYFLR